MQPVQLAADAHPGLVGVLVGAGGHQIADARDRRRQERRSLLCPGGHGPIADRTAEQVGGASWVRSSSTN